MKYYHVAIVKKAQQKDKAFSIYSYDMSKDFVMDKILKPYFSGNNFVVDGYILSKSDIDRLKVVITEDDVSGTTSKIQNSLSDGVFLFVKNSDIFNSRYSKDVTQVLFDEINAFQQDKKGRKALEESKYIFIVHGHDINLVNEVEFFVKSIGYEPIVLFKEADAGMTIIEKIETYSSKSCYGLVLYSKCDVGFLIGHENDKKPRARQNVVFEHGYLMAKLGRDHVCALVSDDDIELPSDISGILYQKIGDKEGYWRFKVAQNMKAAGIDVDLNLIK